MLGGWRGGERMQKASLEVLCLTLQPWMCVEGRDEWVAAHLNMSPGPIGLELNITLQPPTHPFTLSYLALRPPGGQQVAAMDWIFANGGLAAQADYPYVGVNDWCKKDVPKKAFTGKAVLVEGGEEALKEALYTQGPLTVSVDASADSFRFYSGGVYRNEDCKTKAADLDHAVILSGYGTTEEGVDYWLIKNMWSTYWGEQGYMKIPRHPNDCGIAAEPVYVDLKVEG